jgi:hypothetical protein
LGKISAKIILNFFMLYKLLRMSAAVPSAAAAAAAPASTADTTIVSAAVSAAADTAADTDTFVVENGTGLPRVLIDAAVEKYVHELGDEAPYVVSGSILHKFIGENTESMREFVSDDWGWGKCCTENVWKTTFQGVEFFVVFEYHGGSCVLCDSDAYLMDKVESYGKTRIQALELTSNDLREKLNRSKVYRDKASLVAALLKPDLEKRLLGEFPDEMRTMDPELYAKLCPNEEYIKKQRQVKEQADEYAKRQMEEQVDEYAEENPDQNLDGFDC